MISVPGPTLTGLTTVLFDLDGTLVQHGHVLLPPILAQWGYIREIPVIKQAFAQELIWFYNHVEAAERQGWMPNLWQNFYGRLLKGLDVADEDGQRAATITDFYEGNPVPPLFDDAPDLVTALHDAGWQLGVITQRSKAGACRFLETHHLLGYFPVVVAGDDGHGRKPEPGPFQAALEKLGSRPEQAIFVGDRIDDDCEGALNAGLGAVLIDRDDFHAWVDHGAATYGVLRSLAELPPYLQP